MIGRKARVFYFDGNNYGKFSRINTGVLSRHIMGDWISENSTTIETGSIATEPQDGPNAALEELIDEIGLVIKGKREVI